jgi:uncharacterized membrane protein YagU involved in acid resistance
MNLQADVKAQRAIGSVQGLCPFAGVIAGLLAGAAYLGAQMFFSAAVHDADAWAPLQRISAMLLGPDDLPPSADHSATLAGMALLIHFGLAMVFGRFVDLAVRGHVRMDAVLRGLGVGVALYAVNFFVVAPLAFPWFEDSRGLTTLLDHALFGAVAVAIYLQLRMRRPGWVV